jgi:hypothetical protein
MTVQAKDVPDDVFLTVVRDLRDEQGWSLVPWHLIEPSFPDVPFKVLLAKARKLVRRGLLDGCACGCSGSFEITYAGSARVTARKIQLRSQEA